MKTIIIFVTVFLLASCTKESDVTPKTPDSYYLSFYIFDKLDNITYAAFAKPNDIFKPDSIDNELKIDISQLFVGKHVGDTTEWIKIDAKYLEAKKEWDQRNNRFVRFYFNSNGINYRTMIFTFSEDSIKFNIGMPNTYFRY